MHGSTEIPAPPLPARGRGGISCCVKLLQQRGRWEMSPHSNMLHTQQVLTSRLTLDCCEHDSSGSADLFSFPWHQIPLFSQSCWRRWDIYIYIQVAQHPLVPWHISYSNFGLGEQSVLFERQSLCPKFVFLHFLFPPAAEVLISGTNTMISSWLNSFTGVALRG